MNSFTLPYSRRPSSCLVRQFQATPKAWVHYLQAQGSHSLLALLSILLLTHDILCRLHFQTKQVFTKDVSILCMAHAVLYTTL